jgi:hypothetical protein
LKAIEVTKGRLQGPAGKDASNHEGHLPQPFTEPHPALGAVELWSWARTGLHQVLHSNQHPQMCSVGDTFLNPGKLDLMQPMALGIASLRESRIGLIENQLN